MALAVQYTYGYSALHIVADKCLGLELQPVGMLLCAVHICYNTLDVCKDVYEKLQF